MDHDPKPTYETTPSLPVDPDVTVQAVGITRREFALIRRLRRVHFFDTRHNRTAVVLWINCKLMVIDGTVVEEC